MINYKDDGRNDVMEQQDDYYNIEEIEKQFNDYSMEGDDLNG